MSKYNIQDKQRSFRFWEQGDRVKHRSTSTKGMVVGAYDSYVWVLWENASELCGVWKPETESGYDLEFVALPAKSNMEPVFG